MYYTSKMIYWRPIESKRFNSRPQRRWIDITELVRKNWSVIARNRPKRKIYKEAYIQKWNEEDWRRRRFIWLRLVKTCILQFRRNSCNRPSQRSIQSHSKYTGSVKSTWMLGECCSYLTFAGKPNSTLTAALLPDLLVLHFQYLLIL